MKNITTKQFQLLSDNQIVWDLLVENYDTNGVEAPFWEYALTSEWMDKTYLHLCRLWFDRDKAVGFAFFEAPYTDIRFCLNPDYKDLADEMVEYAEQYMPGDKKEKTLVFNPCQNALIQAAETKGYKQCFTDEEYEINFKEAELNYDLPNGFHFVSPPNLDPVKLAICTWKGFGHEDKGPFENWEDKDPGTDWNPQKAYHGIISNLVSPPPHSTYEHEIIIANENDDYVCYSGMWWVPANKLAYMEPLCTIPEYQGIGLASAALSEHYRRMKKLGAECMTGGGNEFYRKIGYNQTKQTLGYKKIH